MFLKNKFLESGRSMVEMLGVLAVIGILSISAVSGYKYAMNRFSYNKMLDTANRFGLMFETESSLWASSIFNDAACGNDNACYTKYNDYFCNNYVGDSEWCQKITPSSVSRRGKKKYSFYIGNNGNGIFGISFRLPKSDCKNFLTTLKGISPFKEKMHQLVYYSVVSNWSDASINKMCEYGTADWAEVMVYLNVKK